MGLLEDSFWALVDKREPEACWPWLGRIHKREGYGYFGPWPAHRLAYELTHGELDKALVMDHLCRVHFCVNPAHLEAVTHRENVLRGVSPIAHNARKTLCLNGHPFDITNARGRACSICNKAAALAWYEANRDYVSEQGKYKRTQESPEVRENRLAWHREYYATHREKYATAEIRARKAVWYAQNRTRLGQKDKDKRTAETPEQRQKRLTRRREWYQKSRANARIVPGALANAENALRGDGPPARKARQTHCDQGHEFERVGRQRLCRTCQRIRTAQWARQHRAKDPESYRTYMREYYRKRRANARLVPDVLANNVSI